MKALIIGGGIGGLATALECERAGIEAHVFESVHEMRPLGVGINLLPHCVRSLDRLGAMEPLLDLGVPIAEQVFCNRFGQRIWSETRGLEAGYKWPQIGIHRGHLQVALMDLARTRLGAGHIHMGRHLTGFDQCDGGGIVAHFSDGKGGAAAESVAGDLLIGADGIHSALRASFYPGEGPAKWNGAIIYRATTETAPFLGGKAQFMAGGRQTFIAYPISRAHAERGRSLTNWAARFFVDPAQGFRREDWNRRADTADFLPRYAGWRFDWIDTPEVMRGADAVYEFPMVDRDPLPRWTFGRATLLGDAAHPMYPLGSNGASQAILDARALVEALTAAPDIDAALLAYEEDRRPRTARIVLQNRSGGPEVVVRLAEERAPNGFDDIESVIPRRELERISATYKKIASADLATVNG